MNEEDIKVGETYNIRMYVTEISEQFFYAKTKVKGIMEGYCFHHSEAEVFSPISPENSKKNTEPAPKYDPCRKFRKGDKVRAVEYKGRRGTDCPNFTGKIYTVSQEERSNGLLKLTDDVYIYYVDPAYVELVTPIEELERYVVEPGDIAWFVVDKKHESGELNVVMYMPTHPNPKAAAEAECAKLNTEWRKEKKNG